ncbi:MAG: MJ1477/TM1410 family putative glycoside hydrolase [Pseudomonadota bacterium]
MTALLAVIATMSIAPPRIPHSTAQGAPKARAGDPAREHRRALIAPVASWGYQLRRLDVAEVAASPFDLVVIDYAPDRTESREIPFTRDEVRRMQAKPGGGRRLVMAYLSIGEAERYRTYWQSAWYEPATRPPWLLGVNPQWDGNFLVQYWHPDWKRIVFGRPESYLDRIVAAGFDGVYLDRADAFQELAGKHPEAEREMVRFIGEIAAYARSVRPELLIVMQNAEELVAHASVRQAIDAIAKEDLLYGVNHDGRRNPAGMIAASLADLRRARRAGLKVLAVEYLEPGEKAGKAAAEARREGFVLHLTERSLGRLTPPAAPSAPPTAAR